MTTTLPRRRFLQLLGLGAAASAGGLALLEAEPIRRYWQVPRNAPVGTRIVAVRLARLRIEGFPDVFGEPADVPAGPVPWDALLTSALGVAPVKPWQQAMLDAATKPQLVRPEHTAPAPFAVRFEGLAPGQVPRITVAASVLRASPIPACASEAGHS